MKNGLEHIAKITQYVYSWLHKVMVKYQILQDEGFLVMRKMTLSNCKAEGIKNAMEHIAKLTKYTDSWLQKMVVKYQFP